MEIVLRPLLKRQLQRAGAHAAAQAYEAMQAAAKNYGKPHMHTGKSIRAYRPPYVEVRVGIDRRILFFAEGDSLVFCIIGTHREVEKWAKNNT